MNDYIGILLAKKRINAVMPFIKGRLLDIGCGYNKLVRIYGNGIGLDVYDWGDVDCLVVSSYIIPYADASFNTVTIIAALNHIAYRQRILQECHRLLSYDGRLIITMIHPKISIVWHRIRSFFDSDQKKRGMGDEEVYGLTSREIIYLANTARFKLITRKRFMMGFNSLYFFTKK